MFALRTAGRQFGRVPRWTQLRCVSTLESNPHIVRPFLYGLSVVKLTYQQYVFPSEGGTGSHILSLLPTEPVNSNLAIGITSKLPPTTDSLRENPKFLSILQEVFTKHAHEDPDAQSQAHVMVSTAGANLYSGGVLLSNSRRSKRQAQASDSSGGASGQGGMGGGGRGGWIHISDSRRPPDYGRIAW